VLYLSFLHLIPDAGDPWGLVRRAMDRTAPGSYLAISHAVADDPESRRKITDFFVARTGGHFGRIRKKSEVRTFFDGLEIVDPGLVNVGDWHADTQQAHGYQMFEYGGVGRKPA